MQVKLNAWRGDHGPGEIIDLDEHDAAAMITHGTAHLVDDLAAEADTAAPTGRVVKGSATLTATSGTDHTP